MRTWKAKKSSVSVVRYENITCTKWGIAPVSCIGLWAMSPAKLAVAPTWHWAQVCTR